MIHREMTTLHKCMAGTTAVRVRYSYETLYWTGLRRTIKNEESADVEIEKGVRSAHYICTRKSGTIGET